MKKILLTLLVGLSLVSCKPKDPKHDFTIGINQFAQHPALDEAREGFIKALEEEGLDVEYIYENAQGEIPNANSISQKFISRETDLIFAIGTPSAQASKQVSQDIPILFSAVTDPVEAELVASLESPGGNISGTTDMGDVLGQLKLFKEISQDIKKIGVLYNTSESNSQAQLRLVEDLARDLDFEIIAMGVPNLNEMPLAIDSLLKKVDGVYALSDNLVALSVELYSKKLLEAKIPSISAEESQVRGGLLLTKGFSYYDLGYDTGKMAYEILVNSKDPSEIPVRPPSQSEVIINRSTWEALGLDENLIDNASFIDN